MIMAHEQILLGQNCSADTYSANFLYSMNLFITRAIVKQPPLILCFGYVIILWQKKCFYQESIGNSNTRHSVRTRIFAFQLSLGLSKSRDSNSFIEFSIFNAIARREPPDSHVSKSSRDLIKIPKCRDQNEKSPPASENAERRKQQNRNSQIAFRERNRMNLKKLQEELIHSQSANEELYSIMEQLLERTEHLKRAIEDVLTSRLKRSQSTTFSSP